MSIQWGLLLVAGWLAASVSGVAGFGGALLLLPVLTRVIGPKAAVPVLTVAQLLGNLSRAGLGRKEIRWRPALAFSAGAVPAGLAGSLSFVALPPGPVGRLIGLVLLAAVALRHTTRGRRPFPERWLVPAGAAVGFLSGVAGSAGPLGAVVFLNLRMPALAYVATEAVTAVLIHLTKSLTYGRFAALTAETLVAGLALGCVMVIGSSTGRELVGRLEGPRFSLLVEALMVVAALSLLFG